MLTKQRAGHVLEQASPSAGWRESIRSVGHMGRRRTLFMVSVVPQALHIVGQWVKLGRQRIPFMATVVLHALHNVGQRVTWEDKGPLHGHCGSSSCS